jgi:hypothetical protein
MSGGTVVTVYGSGFKRSPVAKVRREPLARSNRTERRPSVDRDSTTPDAD